MSGALVWYLILTTVPGSLLTYPRPVGPFTLQDCRKAWATVTVMNWPELADIECRQAIRFEVCNTPDRRRNTARCCCPVFERGK